MGTRSLFAIFFIFAFLCRRFNGQMHGYAKNTQRAADLDQRVVPSMYFTKEPPNQLDFSNNTGAKVECAVGGRLNRASTIEWSLADGSPTFDIRGLRRVQKDGSLIFDPLNSEAFRQDVHTATYRCKATNDGLTIVSRDVKIRAVMDVDYDSSVYDVFAIRGNTAVVKCHVPTFLQEFVHVAAFIKDESLKIDIHSNHDKKYSLSSHGVLYVHNVSQSDHGNSFRCQTLHKLTGQLRVSSTSGKLFVTEPHGNIFPKIIDSLTQIACEVGKDVLLPCVPHGHPTPQTKWSIKNGGHLLELNSNNYKYQILVHGMIIKNVQLVDAGIYVCHINSSSGSDEAEITLTIKAPLKVSVDKAVQKIDLGSSASIHCHVTGYPIGSVSWTKNGRPFDTSKQMDNRQVLLNAIKLEDKGIYQCFASNEFESVQAVAEIQIGAFRPVFKTMFNETIIRPGSAVAMSCSAIGSPTPRFKWMLDTVTLSADNYRVYINEKVSKDVVTSTIRMKVVGESDGGVYSCVAENESGQQQHSARLNVHGPLKSRRISALKIVAGQRAQLNCPVYGYPIDHIQWFKESLQLPMDIRQDLLGNWTLVINDVNKIHDSGVYTCTATSKKTGQNATGEINLSVLARPKVIPFAFQDDQNFKGMRAHITCAVSQGDLPLTFHWLKDGLQIDRQPSLMGIQVANYDQYSGSLSIQSVTSSHSGNYTCVASNEAGKDSFTARLMVQVAPKIVPFNFQGEHLFEGVLARVSCVVYQGDLPIRIQWNRDGQPIDNGKLKGVNVRTVDDFTNILTIDHVTVEHAGNYSCVAKNSAASATHVANLVVKVPPKIVPFAFQEDELAEGSFVRVACVVGRGDLPLNFSWTKDEGRSSLGNGVEIRRIDDYSSVLSIDRVTIDHTGLYTCTATNAAATTAHSSYLRVFVPPKWAKVPNVTVTALSGSQVSLDCEAEGHPTPTITWLIKQGSSPHIVMKALEDGVGGFRIFENGTLSISHVTEEHEDAYFCKATNGIGQGLSWKVQLQIQVPVTILEHSPKQAIRVGQRVSLYCLIRGHQPINATWSVDNKNLSNNEKSRYVTKTESNSTHVLMQLSIPKTANSDANQYDCHVKDFYGQDKATIEVVVEGPPNAPLKVNASNKGNKSVEVAWQTPFDGHSPILKYVIEYQLKKGGPIERMTTNDGYTNNIALRDLQPSSVYKITVMAENAIGLSDDNESVYITLDGEVPSAAPSHIRVLAQNGRSLRVSWQPPPADTWNGAILGYHVGYREGEQPYEYRLLEVPEGYDKGLSFTLSDLKEFTTYGVVVQAFNIHGKGPLSDEVLAMTSEGVPSHPPLSVDCSVTTPTSVTVRWEKPPEVYHQGIIRGYRVLHWTPSSTWNGDTVLSVVNTTVENSAQLKNLFPNTNYSVQVLAFTMAGDGMASKPIYCKTLEDVPSAPKDVKVLPLNSDSIMLLWTPPTKSNGKITHYTVYYEDVAANKENKVIVKGGDTLKQKVNNLRSGQKYNFWVSASTAVGEGQSTPITTASPTSKPTSVRISAFGGVIYAKVDHLLVLQCPIVGGGLNPRIQWLHNNQPVSKELGDRTLLQSDGSLRLPSVQVNDKGNYTCHVSNNQGQDRITYSLVVKVPPPAPVLTVIDTTDVTVNVQWKISSDSSSTPILAYNLHYKREFEPWQMIDVQPYLTKFTIGSLQCGSTYQLYLVARNEVGNSPPSTTLTATTAGGVPLVPSMDKLVEASHAHAIVHLNSWTANSCPILYFALEYKLKTNPSWSLVSSDLSPSKLTVRLNELQPSTWYSVRMTAHTSAGSSMAEYDFSTLDVTEDTMSDDDGQFGAKTFLSFADFNVIVSISSCSVIVLLCLSITCFWVKRKKVSSNRKNKKSANKGKANNSKKKLQKHKAIKSSDSDDDISPYAMVKLSDIHPNQPKPSDHRVAPMCSGGTPLRHSSIHNYNPTAPPMSESYFPRGGGDPSRKYPLLPTNPMYAMPHKEKSRHVRSSNDHSSGVPLPPPPPPLPNQHPPLPDIATIFEFPPPPEVTQDGDYDPPPPEINWLETKR